MTWDTALEFALGSLAVFCALLALVSERHEGRLLFAALVSGVLVILCLVMLATSAPAQDGSGLRRPPLSQRRSCQRSPGVTSCASLLSGNTTQPPAAAATTAS